MNFHIAPDTMSLPKSAPAKATVLTPPFHHDNGYGWRVAISPDLFSITDDVGSPNRSVLTLKEGGVLLGPAHASHADIRMLGAGRYSHWRNNLHFSTSDNSDPNTNGRTYVIEESAEEHYRENALYAMDIVSFYATYLDGGVGSFKGLKVLEVGPGFFLGSVMILACLGADVVVVDPFLPEWDPSIHSKMAASLLLEMQKAGWYFDPAPLMRSIIQGQLDSVSIHTFRQSLESMADELGGTIDLTVSHATFEHLFDVRSAMTAMVHTMKSGATGVHRVDFRDHGNFDRPLEFLMMSQEAYDESCGDNKYGRGNRMRAASMHEILRDTGLSEVNFVTEISIDEGYLTDFMERLRHQPDSTYNEATADSLKVLGGTFLLRK